MGASIQSTKSVVSTSGSDRTLNFYTGDRLYVRGLIDGTSPQEIVAGYLDIDGTYDGTSVSFRGDLDIFIEDGGTYVAGTHDFGGSEPLDQCSDILGILVHADADGFTVDASSKVGSYTTTVAYSVEDLMTRCLPVYGYYDSGSGKIALSVGDAPGSCTPIFNCSLSGLTSDATYTMVYRNGDNLASIDGTKTLGTVTADVTGYIAFACYVSGAATAEKYHGFLLTNTADAGDVKIVTLGTKALASKVYNVTRAAGSLITLTAGTGDVTLNDNDVLTGTGGADTHVTIADGATIWLNGVTIVNTSGVEKKWAGLTCEGDATINLVDGTTNTVHGFYVTCPGIYWPKNKTLTINGDTGALTASCYDVDSECAAGIGTGNTNGYSHCGNIVINGGHITAIGSINAAGIGSALYGTCGDITINGGYVEASSWANCPGIGSGLSQSTCGNILIAGGTVIATGGWYSPGIGSGVAEGAAKYKSICGDITITAGITSVTAIRGGESPDVIGTANELSHNDTSLCGVITFGSQPMYDGSVWTTTPTNGSDYGGLHIVISRTNEDNDTWTLTPATP